MHPNLSIRQLQYFVMVAEERHFRRAAARLHISQPPLTQGIQSLERDLGMQLLVRKGHRVELTDAGESSIVMIYRTEGPNAQLLARFADYIRRYSCEVDQ